MIQNFYEIQVLAMKFNQLTWHVRTSKAGRKPQQMPAAWPSGLICWSCCAGAVDADFALALQLQEEEQRRAAREQQSRQQGQQQQQQGQGHRGPGQARQQQSSSRSSQSRSGSHGRPPSGRSAESSVQSYANPIMQRQQRQGGSQQAQQQQQPEEKSSVGSAFAKFFGWSTKK